MIRQINFNQFSSYWLTACMQWRLSFAYTIVGHILGLGQSQCIFIGNMLRMGKFKLNVLVDIALYLET